MTRYRLLPLLILMAILTLVFRMGEVVTGFRDLSGAAMAEAAKTAAKTEPAAAPEKGKEAATAEAKKEPEKAAQKPMDWPDPAAMDPELAAVKRDLNKDLAARRTQLEAREKDITTREAVFKAAEQELDQKYKELTALRGELQNLLKQQAVEEKERMTSLVKIYEGMKPDDAARIFNTLDLTILLEVMTQMSERKSAPILAKMDADRARKVTLMMAQQKKLPDLSDLAAEPAGGMP